MITKFDSPALADKVDAPFEKWQGRVPARVRMDITVRSDIPTYGDKCMALKGNEYDVWVNRPGAVSAILANGDMLGLKPGEFTVIAFHGNDGEVQSG